ncbi:MAG: CYTH domain-containing protein [Pedobacter sp.]|uniref:CYTH domain-containing protein n=1 Tax=Pedobacter sp. TaxID=1411316 RepID=UPI0028076AB7|nr:CYTH domain-containing protein [Pedobacter sp.]MDQ8004945.1 CYTH domain-containing protein [Pedobacter sp.]
MAIEIEHKYLVSASAWGKITDTEPVQIRQGYLQIDPNKTIRVRTKANQGFITIKGKTKGASRLEFEYEIPIADANELLDKFCSNLIEKMRHYVIHNGKTWEVDVFSGLNAGLIVAEIELTSEEETYTLPSWVTENVTNDVKYANSNLAIMPFAKW